MGYPHYRLTFQYRPPLQYLAIVDSSSYTRTVTDGTAYLNQVKTFKLRFKRGATVAACMHACIHTDKASPKDLGITLLVLLPM